MHARCLSVQHVARTAALALLSLWAAAPTARAQLAVVQGHVVGADNEEPLGGVNVVLEGPEGRRGRATDDAGRFTFRRLTPGRYTLTASFVGYQTRRDTLALSFGDRQVREIRLREQETKMEDVTVEDERTDGDPDMAGVETIRPAQLERVPAPSLSADLAAYLQMLPGIVASDQSGQLFVRGGTPTQNLVLVDGMPVYQPFHLIGFYSAFPADIISHADVYAGGFGAQYGGRLSSVVDVTTRNGNKERVDGALSLAPFLSSLRLEIPFVPKKISVTASVRESVVERMAPALYGRDLPYRFGDRFGKVHAFLSEAGGLSLTGLNSFDEGNLKNSAGDGNRIRRSNLAAGAHFYNLPPRLAVMLEVSAYYSRFENHYNPVRAPERSAQIEGFGGEMSFTYFWQQESELHFGIFGRTNLFDNELGPSGKTFKENITEGGFFADLQWNVTPSLRLAPGLRAHSFPSRGQFTLEPRLRGRWQLSDRHQLNAAWGLYHQQIIGLHNPNDVTDIFIAWRPPPENEPLPTAIHHIGGWEGNLLEWLRVSAEGYYKHLRHMASTRFAETGAAVSIERVDGTARGLDLRLTFQRAPFFGYVGYGLAEVTYESPNGMSYHPPHDRRHQLSALAQFDAGPYALSARWQYGSGQPFTRAAGFYEELSTPTPDGDDFHTEVGRLNVLLEAPFQGRLPAYHRLDISVERAFTFQRAEVTFQATLINAYNRPNLFDYNLLTQRRINQLPLLPSVGLKVALD